MSLEYKPNLYILRHAESRQNINRNLDRDSSLTDLGHIQVPEVVALLKLMLGREKPAVIVHTGLKRTLDTAVPIKSIGGFDAPLVEIPEFREREMGIYDQMDFLEFVKRNPQMGNYYKKYRESCIWFFESSKDGVESLEEMRNRITKGLQIIYEQFEDKPVILVAHAGSLKMTKMLYEEDQESNMAEYLSSFVPNNCQIYNLK